MIQQFFQSVLQVCYALPLTDCFSHFFRIRSAETIVSSYALRKERVFPIKLLYIDKLLYRQGLEL